METILKLKGEIFMTKFEKIALAVTGVEFLAIIAFGQVIKFGADEMAKRQGYKNAKDLLNDSNYFHKTEKKEPEI